MTPIRRRLAALILLITGVTAYAQVQINNLPPATLPLSGSELTIVQQACTGNPGGCTRKAAVSSIGNLISLTAGTGITLTPNPITSTGTISLTTPVAAAGPVKSVQWSNGSGVFEGNTDFTWDDTNSVLLLGSLAIGGPTIGTQAVTGPVANSVLIQGGFASTSGTQGGDALVEGGSSTSGAGGNAQLIGGAGTGTGAGGAALIRGGSANNAAGGGVSITTFSGNTSGNSSSNISLTTGLPNGSGNSGAISLLTGSTTSGTAGNISISTGSSNSGGTSGSISLIASHNSGGTDGSITLASHGATTITSGAGIQVGAPTGGDCGVGCLNSQSLRINNVAVSTATGANPTGTVGLTTVNGSASTFMRSDAAPPLSTGISPTWSGTHTFSNAITVNGGGSSLTGGVTITAPASGTAFTATGTGSAVVIQANGAGNNRVIEADSTNAGGPIIGLTVSGTDLGFVGSAATTVTGGSLADFSIVTQGNHNLILGTNSTSHVSVSGTGNVTVNAPSAGSALTVNGLANANTGVFVGSSTSGQSFGVTVKAGTNSSDTSLLIENQSGSTNFVTVSGDGGTQLGSPTGGDEGLGTINAASGYFLNGVNTRVLMIQGTCSTGTCTSADADGFSSTISRVSTGVYNLSYTPTFASGRSNCVVSLAPGSGAILVPIASGATGTGVQVQMFTTGNVAADGNFSLMCKGAP